MNNNIVYCNISWDNVCMCNICPRVASTRYFWTPMMKTSKSRLKATTAAQLCTPTLQRTAARRCFNQRRCGITLPEESFLHLLLEVFLTSCDRGSPCCAERSCFFSTPPLVFKDGADWQVTTALTTAVGDFDTVNRSIIRENIRRQPSLHFC